MTESEATWYAYGLISGFVIAIVYWFMYKKMKKE